MEILVGHSVQLIYSGEGRIKLTQYSCCGSVTFVEKLDAVSIADRTLAMELLVVK